MSKPIYESEERQLEFGRSETANLAVLASETAMWDRDAYVTLTFGTGTVFTGMLLAESDLRWLAGEMAHAANTIRRHKEGKVDEPSELPAITKNPTLRVVRD